MSDLEDVTTWSLEELKESKAECEHRILILDGTIPDDTTTFLAVYNDNGEGWMGKASEYTPMKDMMRESFGSVLNEVNDELTRRGAEK